jgi:predicted ATPase/class 3 adenylate cyclase
MVGGMPVPPSGTVTFLFTDIQGSTQRWEREPAAMSQALHRHDDLLRSAIESNSGYVFKTVGDAFCAGFPTAGAALQAALAAQRAVAAEPWPTADPLLVRVALHAGAAELHDGDYFGPAVNRVARLVGAGHGGQILLSLSAEQLVRDCLPPEVSLVDLGEHRLKDLHRSERIFQLLAPDLPSDFPTLRTLSARAQNLPVQRTSLVGREQELSEVVALLRRDDVRLVTLLGPGGTGKTRLSLQVAAELLDDFEHGVFFVPLASATSPDELLAALARAIDLQECGDQPLLERIQAFVAPRKLLLVLDNFEQVPGGERCVDELLAAAPNLKVLVTSRFALHLYGEQEYQVPPLPLPDPSAPRGAGEVGQSPAVALFVQRAQAVRPDFALDDDTAATVADLCARLDGLPLAIELAAARVKLLPPRAMLARLVADDGRARLRLLAGGPRDLPSRQQTLRDAIAWSYDLLDEPERLAFHRLAVFSGGFSLEAAEALCASSEPLDGDLFDTIASLVDKSFLRQEERAGEPRFGMLEMLREFGLEQLEADGEQAIRDAHAAYFLELAERSKGALRGRLQRQAFELLEQEHENLRAAQSWLHAQGRVDQELRLTASLWQFWWVTGRLSEGERRLHKALDQPSDGALAGSATRASALFGLGVMEMLKSDYPASRRDLAAAAVLYGRLGDSTSQALSEATLGQVETFTGNREAATKRLVPAIETLRALDRRWELALALAFDGFNALAAGDPARALASSSEGLAIVRQLGDRWGAAMHLGVLGLVALEVGEYEAARSSLEEAAAIRRSTGESFGLAHNLNSLGDLERRQNRPEQARQLYQQSLEAFRRVGVLNGEASSLHNLGYAHEALGDHALALGAFQQALALFQQLGDRRGIAECLAGLSGSLLGLGLPHLAARLFGASERLREATAATLSAVNRAEYARNLEALRAALDAATLAREWQDGRGRPLSTVLAQASVASTPAAAA